MASLPLPSTIPSIYAYLIDTKYSQGPAMDFKLGDLVDTDKGPGTVAFAGTTEFAEGNWVGVVLDEPRGKNNGSVQGVAYFECADNHGIFYQRDKVRPRGSPSIRPSASANRMNTSTSSSASAASSTISGIRPPAAIRKPAARVAVKPTSTPPSKIGSASSIVKGAPPAGKQPPQATAQALGDRQKSFGTSTASKLATPTASRIPSTSQQPSRIAEPAVSKPVLTSTPSTTSTGIPQSRTREGSLAGKGDEPAPTNSRRESVAPVRERARRIDSQSSSMDSSVYKPAPHGHLLPQSTMAELSNEECVEIEYLKREVKDLGEKLDTLRTKRREDQEKLKEYERNKIHLQTLLEFKAEMSAAHSALKAKYDELAKAHEDLERDFQSNTDVNQLLEQLAIVEVDKEMAEERVGMLQAELTQAEEAKKELVEEVTLLKEELELAHTAPAEGGDASTRVHSKQLEQQNDRYKEAILCLRDALGRANSDLELLRKEHDQAKSERDEVTQLCEKMEKELAETRESITQLREEADSAMGAEKMISLLTDKNLDLEDRIKALEEDVAELELLRQMDEEIMESLKEAERDLRGEMDQQLVAISDLRRQLAEGDKRGEDLELVIRKFRQKQADLNELIQQQKDEILILKEQDESRGADENTCFSLRAVTLNRTFSEIVDAELAALELDFSRKQAAYLKNFLPDNFTRAGGDNDCLLLCVLFPRMAVKCDVLQKLLAMKYPPVPNGMRREHITLSHKAEQWAHVKRFNYTLRALHATMKKFESVLDNCSVDRLSRLAIQQLEITGQERHLDAYVELLKQNRLDENTSVEGLERVNNFFQKVFSTNLSSETFNCREALMETVNQLREGFQWAQFNTHRLRFFLPEGPESESSDFAKQLQQIQSAINECESLCMRALNRVPAENDLMISAETTDKIFTSIAQLERCARILHDTCSYAASQLSMIDANEGFPSAQMKEMLQASVEKLTGQRSSTGSDGANKAFSLLRDGFDQLRNFLDELSEALENSSMEIPPAAKGKNVKERGGKDGKMEGNDGKMAKNCTKNEGRGESEEEIKGFPPLLERAHSRKQDAVEAEGLRWQLSKKDEEVLKLQKAVKTRDGDLSTMRLRLEMADRQMAEAGGKNADARLQQRVSQLQEDFLKQKEDYEKHIESLQLRLEHTEREREKEKERAKEFSKKALFANMAQTVLMGGAGGSAGGGTSPLTPTSLLGFAPGFNQHQQHELAILDREYRITLQDLKWAEHRIRDLESQLSARLIDEMGVLDVPDDPVCGRYSLKSPVEKRGDEAELQRMIKESEQLMAESNSNLLEPVEAKKREEFRERAARINDRIDSLKHRFHRYWARKHPGEELPTFSSHLREQLSVRQDESAPERKSVQSILEKWNRELMANEKLYGGGSVAKKVT